MARTERTAPVVVQINATILGYLAAITKTDAKMVMVNLRDIATATVDRLRERDHGYSTWSKVFYPGTGDLPLKVKCSLSYHQELRQKHWKEREERCHKEIGLTYIRARWGSKKHAAAQENNNKYHAARQKWYNDNPDPYKDFDYSALLVEFEVYGRGRIISMTQDEIDTVLIEDILLAPTTEEDDERGSIEPGP
jgi:hypothetical protein